jgi:hypothetical protein
MPEAFAVLAVVVVAFASWLGAWMHTRNPANDNPRSELLRLQLHAAWLEDRLGVAERENWSSEMTARLAEELGSTLQQLRQAAARA